MKKYFTYFKIILFIIFNFINKLTSNVVQPTPYIIGGTTSPITVAPYIASIQYSGQHFCAGSLITPCHILTAAHCLVYEVSRLTVRLNSATYKSGGILAKVITYIRHPDYDSNLFSNDYGIIQITNCPTVSTAPLPTKANGSPGPNGTQFVTAGWGLMYENATTATDDLQSVEIPLIDFATCNQTLTNMGFPYLNDTCEFCAGEDGKDSCRGDSGGPCIRKSDKVLIGITSFGMGCGHAYGGVYAKVVYILDWIQNVTSKYYCVTTKDSTRVSNLKKLVKV